MLLLLFIAIILVGGSGTLWYFYSIADSLALRNTYLISAVCLLCFAIIFVFIYTYKRQKNKINKLKEQIEIWSDTTYHINAAGDMAFQSLPIGIMIYDKDYNIKWFNDYAQKSLKKSLKDVGLGEVSVELERLVKSSDADPTVNLKANNKTFEFHFKKENRILYFFDITRETELRTKYINKNLAIGIIVIDNLEESLKRYDLQDKTQITGQIFGEINNWANSYKCHLETLDDDRILIVTDREELEKMVDDKISILDKIRTLSKESHLKTTISVGIAAYDSKANEVGDLAQTAVELAEKRGGDQAVVNIQNAKIQYIGGQANALEKNTLVAVRMQTNSLKELVDTYEKTLIMVHNQADMDALGAAIAALRLVESFKNNVKIVLEYDRLDQTAKKAYDMLIEDNEAFKNHVIDEAKALNYLTSNTLLLVCDSQSPTLVMFKSVIEHANHVAVIDHHRVGEIDFTNVEMSYVETYSSSTVELVTEMFKFAGDVKINQMEATIMLAGIVVDSNYFTYRTGYRTFEVASTLKEYGADMVKVKMILRDTYDAEKVISEAVCNSEVVLDRFAIAAIDETKGDRTILAKISDRLLTIENIRASFTIAKLESGEVGISARSLENVNVQMIMEEMGGGGHLQAAACQIKDKTIDEVKEWIIDILKRDYSTIEGEDKMKVILIKDVKGKGKKDSIIDVNNGYGNFLISNGDAVAYNEQNIKALEESKKQEAIDEENRRQLLLQLKSQIDGKNITLYIKQGADGKLFGHITPKQVVEQFDAEHGIRIDKRKLELPTDINNIGIYQANINLDKNIQATFNITVVGL